MIFVIQNDPEVPLGEYGEYLGELSVPFRTLRPYAGEAFPAAGEASGVIVLGGAMGANDDARHQFLVELKRFIRETVRANKPYFGICLGGQLLAAALGGSVTSNSRGEKGTLAVQLTTEGENDPLFAGVERDFISFQWHNDSFDIPEGAVLLASSPACANQAFRVGQCAYGVQFHPEMTTEMVDAWSRWTEETAGEAEQFVAAFTARQEAYRSASRRMLENFVGIVTS